MRLLSASYTRHYFDMTLEQIKQSIRFIVSEEGKKQGHHIDCWMYETPDGDCIGLSYCWEDEKWNCYSIITSEDFNYGVTND